MAQDIDSQATYNHAQWETRRRFLRFLLRRLGVPLLVKMESVEGLENIPAHGSGILMMNHIAFVDSIIILHCMPRNIVPMGKIEAFNYPVIGLLPRLWYSIPVHREEVDRKAIRMSLDVLRAGEIILLAPEATRSTQLNRGKEGVAYLASKSEAPIIPVAVEGTPGFPALRYTSRWRDPGVRIKFGKPFRYRPDIQRPGRDQLRQMTDEAMYILSAMLPEARRGTYADLSNATRETIEGV